MEIDATRASTPTINHPLSNVRAWRQSRVPDGAPEKEYALQREALVHWRRFCACLEGLPADQAEHVWRTVSVEMSVAQVRLNVATTGMNEESVVLPC